MPELRFGVLGTLEVRVGGQPRGIPAGRQRAVLVCLLAHAGRPVPVDALVEAAWGDGLPKDPRRALRTVISRLRARLGHSVIRFGPAGYHLVEGVQDADEFAQLVQEARAAEPTLAGDLLSRALALWRGPAYGEYADTPVVATVAEHLEHSRRDAVEARAAALLQAGTPAEAVTGLEVLLAEQPFRESAVELLARVLYHAGRQTEALQRLRGYRGSLGAELGLDPSPWLTELEGRILGHELAVKGGGSGGPPAWLDTSSAFIGREDDLADLVGAVVENQVTVVTGPGGVGKSRLAAEAMPQLHGRLGLPIVVVELAAVRPGVTVGGGAAEAVAEALGLQSTDEPGPHGGLGPDALVEFLAAVPHLLILDNCEHLLDELAPLVTTVARRCRDVRVLATSRHRLGVVTERILPLSPLRLPESGATTGSQEAAASMRLFGDLVRRLRPAFSLTADNAPQVAELCRRCDGLPLALEIAASRVATTGVSEVLERLTEDLAADGLAGVVQWSYRLLGEAERSLVECLSVFAGDFDAAAVRGLVGRTGDAVDPTAALAELVESSLVARHTSGEARRGGGDSYRLLEMVRAFAVERLEESGRAEAVSRAHAEWVRDVVTAIREDWPRVDGAVVSARLARCAPEAVAALRWTLLRAVPEPECLVLAAGITHALVRCWHWTPGPVLRDLIVEVGQRVAAAETMGTAQGTATAAGLAAGAFHAGEQGDITLAVRLATTALDRRPDRDTQLSSRLALAVAAMYSGDHDESVRQFRVVAADPDHVGEGSASLALLACYSDDLVSAREHAAVALSAGDAGSDHTLAFARYAAGEVEAATDPARGAALLAAAVAEAERVGAEQVSRVARLALFALLVRGDQGEQAVTLGLRLVTGLRRQAAWNQVWTLVRMVAELLADHGRWSDAAFLLGAAAETRGAPPLVGADVERYAQLRARLSAQLGVRVRQRIEVLAEATPRTRVLSRVERCLHDLTPDSGRPDQDLAAR